MSEILHPPSAMNSRLIPEELQPILRKVEQGIRVSSEDRNGSLRKRRY